MFRTGLLLALIITLTACGLNEVKKVVKVGAVGATALAVTNPISALIITAVDAGTELLLSAEDEIKSIQNNQQAFVHAFKEFMSTILIAYIFYEVFKRLITPMIKKLYHQIKRKNKQRRQQEITAQEIIKNWQ